MLDRLNAILVSIKDNFTQYMDLLMLRPSFSPSSFSRTMVFGVPSSFFCLFSAILLSKYPVRKKKWR